MIYMLNKQEIEQLLKQKNNWFNDNEIKEILENFSKNSLEVKTPANKDNIFKALKFFKPEETKVIILGQDPYPNEDRADGLAFSFGNNADAKDSLKNIFEEINKNFKIDNKKTNLEKWAQKEHILLLNVALTFKDKNSINEHRKIWSYLINKIIEKVINERNERKKPLVIMLWGKYANLFEKFNCGKNKQCILILRASHPSNLGKNYRGNYKTLDIEIRPFTSCNHFKECNDFLERNGEAGINWSTEIEEQ